MSTPVLYDVFLPYVYPLVPLAPEPSAIIAIRSAAIDFCRNSLLLQQQMDAISTAAGISDTDIDVPTNTMLVQVMTLYYSGVYLPRRTLSEISGLYTRDWQLLTGTPRCFTQLSPTTVSLVLAPDTSVTNALTGIIALAPTRASTLCDGQLFDRYVEVIAHGAAARLCAIPGQKFSDKNAAVMMTRQFNADVANVRSAVTAGQNRTSMRIRFNKGR